MFDIGFFELLLVGVLGLLVLGPERLPGVIRTTSLWIGRLRASARQLKTEIEREAQLDEIKLQLHNEAILRQEARGESGDEHLPFAVADLLDPTPRPTATSDRAESTPDQPKPPHERT